MQGVEGGGGGGGRSNPLQEPFGMRDKAAGSSRRRRRRGAPSVPAGIVEEAALDETSANWIPDQVHMHTTSLAATTTTCVAPASPRRHPRP